MECKEIKSDFDNKFNQYFINKIEPNDDFSLYDYSDTNNNLNLSDNYFDTQSKMDLNGSKNEELNTNIVKKIFEVIYPKKIPLFTNIENESTDISSNSEITSLKRKRNKIRRRRRENSDNIRKKIKIGFINGTMIKKLNDILKQNGIKLNFDKFPHKFIANIKKETNKKLLNLTLLEIFVKKELYPTDDLKNFYHNLKVVQNKEIEENEELKEILNKTYCELFEEYINSKEFNIDEINRLKKNFDNSYIESYICLAKHFIEFFKN